jgi:hypothetical protein
MRTGNTKYGKKGLWKKNYPLLRMHWTVLEAIIYTIGFHRAESGGAFGSNGEDCGVSHFHFDLSSSNSACTYSPDYKLLNQLFKARWNPQGIRLSGFVHSHPGLLGRPSRGDEVYAERILKAIDDLECLWLPIINTVPDTNMFRFTPWVALRAARGVSVVKGKIEVINTPPQSSLEVCGVNVLESIQLGVPLDEIVIGKQEPETSTIWKMRPDYNDSLVIKAQSSASALQEDILDRSIVSVKHFNERNTFDRVQNAYDLDLMQKTRIIVVGAGGAADWLEAMARTGLGQFVMIDPDVVSETNLATQQTYRKDIGRPKVDCIAERIRDINPRARALSIQKSFDDIADDELLRLVFDPIDDYKAEKTIICGLTDDFFAQARVNRVALNLGIPSLSAQVYLEGRGAEITFTYPGVTPACHRCILSSRYRDYLDLEQVNEVTSHGTPIFATIRLNAIKGFLMLALIHHGTNHQRWGDMLTRIGKRNLIQLRMDPDLADTLGMKVFDRVFEKADREKLFFDDVVWLPQDQECPETGYECCPDCGGTGDLRYSIGKFKDTRYQLNETTVIQQVDVPINRIGWIVNIGRKKERRMT